MSGVVMPRTGEDGTKPTELASVGSTQFVGLLLPFLIMKPSCVETSEAAPQTCSPFALPLIRAAQNFFPRESNGARMNHKT